MKKLNPFKPTDIGGCQLWLDGADLTTQVFTGASITSWNDKSGNGYHMNQLPPTGEKGPSTFPTAGTAINGQSTVYFNLTAGLKQTTLLNGAKNMYWVGRISSIVFGVGYSCYFLFGSDTTYDWHANDYSPTNTMLLTEYASSGITAASPTSLFTSDSNAVVNTTFGSILFPTAPSVSILSVAGLTGSTRYQGICYDRIYHSGWCGDLAEVLVFSNALTTPQHQKIEGYLAQKWGLEANLPAGSPGRTQVIYPHTLRLNSLTTGQPTRLPLIRPLRVSVITPGSVFHLDAGNPTSYPGSGSTWTDLAGSGLTTTLFGSPTYSSANGGYLSFAPASSQYGQTSASLSALTRWTVEIWHYYSATNGSGNPCILSEVWNSTPINFTIGSAAFGGNTTLQAAYFNSVWYYTASNYSLPSVGWYQIVGTYDGTNIKLYINNVLTQTQASAGTPASSGLGIRLMRRWDLGNYWGGRLAIVRIYNRALLASEVTTNYADSKARFGLS